MSLTRPLPDDSTQTGNIQRTRDPFRYLMQLTRKYGDVAPYRAGRERAFLVTEADLIKHVLVDNAANYSKATYVNSVFKNDIAAGLLVSEGSYWRRQRRLMTPAFHTQRLARLGGEITDATVSMLDRWSRIADVGTPIDLTEEMGALTMTVTGRMLFGSDLEGMAMEAGRVIAGGLTVLSAPERPEFKAAVRQIEEITEWMIAERRRRPSHSADLMTMLMEARDADTGEAMTDRELRDELITLILAGYETTANSLSWTCYLLARNHEALDQVRRELRTTCQDRIPMVSDLPALPYTRMVIEESLRLYPPAWIMGRRALGRDRLGEVEIEEGSVVAVSPYITHRREDYFPDPERFDPERFTWERCEIRKPFAYIPFGGGRRLCIGHNMAMLEAQLVVATIAPRFDIRLVDDRPVEPERKFVLRPRGGLPVTIHRLAA
jgi:cytochrome P450